MESRDAAGDRRVPNVADKRKLYGEICRVLKPGGRFAFQEMAAGIAATSYFPLPWASDPADNFLVSAERPGTRGAGTCSVRPAPT
jgi:ubiquinone/menaquinone biosynthesis C-methylase UbiE